MKKRILASILCAALVCGLASGCSQKAKGGSKEAASASPSSAVSERIANAQKTGKYPTVTVAFMNFSGAPKGVKDVQEALNQYTEKNLGLDVELRILDIASYQQQLTLMLSSGEKLDVYNGLSPSYTSNVNNGYTLDLEKDKLIQTYGQGIIKVVGENYLDACRVDGTLYGIPALHEMATGLGCFSIGAKYLDEIGYDYKSQYKNASDEIIHTDINTINDIFVKLHQKNPSKVVFAPQTATLSQSVNYDGLGDLYGVLLNYGQDLTVKDLFASDAYMNFCEQFYQWNKAGYISKDAMTNTIGSTDQVKAGTAMSYATAGKPGIRAQESGLCGQSMIIFQTGKDFARSGAASAMPWCINSNTKDAVAAMQFLNAAYSDPAVSNFLCWGVEGKEYKVTSDGHIDFADGVNASNSPYYNNVNWEMPNQFIAHVFVGDDLTIWDRMKTFNADAVTSKAQSFVFNNTSVATEYTALANVYNQYQKQLEYGFTDPKVGIPEMDSKLKAAGLEKYMTAKQTQLDAWAKNNK